MGKTKTVLGTSAISLAYSAFFEFLFDSSPLLSTDGYYLIVTLLKLPPSYIKRVYKIWDMILSRRPLPKFLSTKGKLVLILTGGLSIRRLLFTMVMGSEGELVAREMGYRAMTVFQG